MSFPQIASFLHKNFEVKNISKLTKEYKNDNRTIINYYNEKSIDNQKNNSNHKNKKITEKINVGISPSFNSNREMVIRKSDFADKMTFAIKADKAAFELSKEFMGGFE